ncbi:MAG: hypothetical protein HOK80_09135 [Candidatus Cloacimonetes bacterium]|jgi:hypothetical protein|nr:hypothetical protein [Candidatus Cloacimonadota bacterium]
MTKFDNTEETRVLIPAGVEVPIVLSKIEAGTKAGSAQSKHPGRMYDFFKITGVILDGKYKGKWVTHRVICQVERLADGPEKFGFVRHYTQLRKALGLEPNEIADTVDDVPLLAADWIGKVVNGIVSTEDGWGDNAGKKYNGFKDFNKPTKDQRLSLKEAYAEWEARVKAEQADDVLNGALDDEEDDNLGF